MYEWFERLSRCWISTQWTIPRYQSTSVFPTSSNSWWNAKPFSGECRAAEKGRQVFGHTWYIGKRFLQIQRRLLQHLMRKSRTCGALMYQYTHHTCDEWKPNTSSGSEMPVQTVSQKIQSSPVREDFSKNYRADQQRLQISDPPFWQIHHASSVRLLEDKIQDWGMYLFTISYGSYAVDQRSGVGWFSGWSKIFVLCKRNSNAKFWSTRCEDRFSTEQKPSIIPASKEGSVWRNKKTQKEDRFLRGRPIAYLIYEYFRVTGANDSVENYADIFTLALRNDDIQEFGSKWDGILLSMTKIPSDDIMEGLYKLRIRESIVQMKNTRVWETQDRIGIVQYGDSSEESRTWWSQIEDNGEQKYRAESTNQEFWGQKRKLWKERRGQESGDKTAWTKKSGILLAMEANGQCSKGDKCSFPSRYR